MKKLLGGVILLVLVPLHMSAGILDMFGLTTAKEGKEQLLLTAYDKYKQQHIRLKDQLARIQAGQELQQVNRRVEKLSTQITDLKAALAAAQVSQQEFLQKKLQISVDIYQELTNLQLAHQQYQYQIEQTIKALDVFLQNPDFEDLKTPIKSSYQFDEYQEVSKQLLSVTEEIERKKLQRENLAQDIVRLDKQLALVSVELKNKERDQLEVGGGDDALLKGIYDTRSRGELVDLQKELLEAQRQTRETKKLALRQEQELVDIQLFVLKSKLAILEQNSLRIERALYVNEFDLYKAQNELSQRKNDIQQEQVVNSNKIAQLTAEREALKVQFDDLNTKSENPIKDIAQLTDWSIDLATLKATPAIVQLGNLNDSIIRLDREIALLESQQDLAKIKLQSDELSVTILQTWYKITQSKFKTDAARLHELNSYRTLRDDLLRELSVIKSKDSAIATIMSSETRSLTNIKRRLQELGEQQDQLMQQYGDDIFSQSTERLKASQAVINRQLDLNGQIIKTYSTISSIIKDMLKHINQVIGKLEKIGGIWQRAPQALTWSTFSRISSELSLYWADVAVSITQSRPSVIISSIIRVINNPANRMLVVLISILMFLWLLTALLKGRERAEGSMTVVRWIMQRWWLWALVAIYIFLRADAIVQVGYAFRVLFYIACIPIFCYQWQSFVSLLRARNAELNYPYVSPELSRRIFTLLAIIGHVTIFIVLFKHSFVATLYSKSDLPPILASIHGIVISTCIILVLHPATISHWLYQFGPWGIVAGDMVTRYYAAFITVFVAILLLADPVLGGYGKLVRFAATNGLLTLILIAALVALHNIIKNVMAEVFFDVSDEPVRERFTYAKTWYGLFVIIVFGLLGLIAILVGAYIWGKPLAFGRFVELLSVEIFAFNGYTAGGQVAVISFTVRSLIILVSFIFGGFLAAWTFQRLVLNRVFNLFLVDSGVQNTVSRISHYFIFLTVFFIGLQRLGFGTQVQYGLGLLLFGIAWAAKGPANDFFAYFTILVERSIKIGDYISLDESGNVSGVVRRITPRSVVLRKKNSVTIIVPNSQVAASSVVNWNYSRGFIGLDDITFVVPYGTDPLVVKETVSLVFEQHSAILKSPAPVVRLNAFRENGMEFMARGFISSVNVLNQWEIASEIRFGLVTQLQKVNIELAAPICFVKIVPSKTMKGVQEIIEPENFKD